MGCLPRHPFGSCRASASLTLKSQPSLKILRTAMGLEICWLLQEDQSLLAALEACSEEALGGRNWMARLDPDFLDNLGRYRKYRPDSLRDLLRVIRNKHNHFRELPDALQAKLGALPDGFLR